MTTSRVGNCNRFKTYPSYKKRTAMQFPVAAEFCNKISQPPFPKAVRDDGGFAHVDILQCVMQQSDLLGITDASMGYRSLV